MSLFDFILHDGACAFSDLHDAELPISVVVAVFCSHVLTWSLVLLPLLFVATCTKRFFLLTVAVLSDKLVNVGLKQLFRIPRPERSCLNDYGMPSGHAQHTAFLCTLSIGYAYIQYRKRVRCKKICGVDQSVVVNARSENDATDSKYKMARRSLTWLTIVCVCFSVCVCMSRVILYHSTIGQVCVGYTVGILVALLVQIPLRRCLFVRHDGGD